jgi:hypothetical protein
LRRSRLPPNERISVDSRGGGRRWVGSNPGRQPDEERGLALARTSCRPRAPLRSIGPVFWRARSGWNSLIRPSWNRRRAASGAGQGFSPQSANPTASRGPDPKIFAILRKTSLLRDYGEVFRSAAGGPELSCIAMMRRDGLESHFGLLCHGIRAARCRSGQDRPAPIRRTRQSTRRKEIDSSACGRQLSAGILCLTICSTAQLFTLDSGSPLSVQRNNGYLSSKNAQAGLSWDGLGDWPR